MANTIAAYPYRKHHHNARIRQLVDGFADSQVLGNYLAHTGWRIWSKDIALRIVLEIRPFFRHGYSHDNSCSELLRSQNKLDSDRGNITPSHLSIRSAQYSAQKITQQGKRERFDL
jgi:hypothetical protein